MNTAQVLGYPLLIIAAFELILGLLLLKQNPRNSPVNKATAACAFASALWSFSAALMYINVSLGRDFLFFARFSWVGWFTVPTAIQTVLYLADEQSRKARVIGRVLYPFWTVVLGLCLFTDLVVTDQFMPLPYRNSPGPLELPLRAFGSLSAFWLIAEIIRLRRRTSGYRRSQLGYYLFGTVIFGTGGAVIGGLLQVFTGSGLEPSLSAYFSLPWVVMIFYAITRHRLFDIRIVVSRSLYILILSFSVSAFQFVLFKMLEPVVGAVATIFISVPLVGIVFFGTPLGGNVERWINEMVLRGSSRYQQVLKDSAGALVGILDHDEVLRFTVETVRKGIGVREVCLYLRGEDGAFVQRSFGTIRPESVEGSVLPQHVAARLLDTGQPIVREELSPDASGADPELMETVRRMDAELILPLSAKGAMLGVLTLSGRSSGEPYLPGDIDALHTLTSHAAAAIENARLFEEAVRARASQKESEDIFRTLAETTAAAICILRLDRVLYVNKAGARMSGYGREELLTMNPWLLVHPDHRTDVFERGRSFVDGLQVPPENEFRFVTKSGEERWVVAGTATIEFQGGPAILSTMVDITERKRAEEALRKSEERFRHVAETAQEWIWEVDREGRYTYASPVVATLLGYRPDEVVGKHFFYDFFVPEERERLKREAFQVFAARSSFREFTNRNLHKDGREVYLSTSGTPLLDGAGNLLGYRGVDFDITERIRAERERNRLYEESVIHYQALLDEQHRHGEEKEKILKDLHDGIGGITTNINLLAELALKQEDLPAVKRSLSTIAELSRESLSEIRSFLQSLDARELSWQAIAAEFRHIGSTVVESHGIRFSIDIAVPEGAPDPGSAVAMNLFRIYKESLANIIKHARATAVEVRFAVQGGRVSLEVRDNGVGLDGERGSGRGIANIKNRALEMGGDLTVASGNGTRLRIEFPIP